MVIKASAAAEIRQLITALGRTDEVRREVAIARLAVIGARAVDGLHKAFVSDTDRETRVAVLRALESIGDRRTIAIARQALGDGGDDAVAGAAALRALLDSPDGPTSTEALDVLVATALDTTADRTVRLAAYDALKGIPEGVRARVAEALRSDPDERLKARVEDASSSALRTPARKSTTLTSPGVVSSVLRAACDASQAPFGENASADTGPQIPPQ